MPMKEIAAAVLYGELAKGVEQSEMISFPLFSVLNVKRCSHEIFKNVGKLLEINLKLRTSHQCKN